MSTYGNLGQELADAISALQDCRDGYFSITLDQVDDLIQLKDEIDHSINELEKAERQLADISAIIEQSRDVVSNADSMR